MSIRERLYPSEIDAVTLARHCQDARYVWNLGLEQRNFWKRGIKSPSVYDQKKSLAEARKDTWLGEGSSVFQQEALRDLARSFKNWWDNPRHFPRPTWRKAGIHEGFYVLDLSVRRINRKWGEVLVPKTGWVRFRLTRTFSEIEASTSARVTLDRSGKWHVSFTQPQPELLREPTAASVGLDTGIVATVTTSDGVHMTMPRLFTPGEAKRKRRLQRKLARQKKGSNRRTRTKRSIGRLSARESDRRKDWIEKTTTTLVKDYDLIAIEDLKVRNMTRSAKGTVESPGKNVAQKKGLNREILNQSWSMFRKRLQDKASSVTSPVEILAVNPRFTYQTCPQCGNISAKNRKSQALFACTTCGYEANADVNAAQNILAAGLGPLWGVAGRRGTPHALVHSGPMKRQPLEGSAA